MTDWFFDGWGGIGRIVLVGTLAYAGLIVILRLTGKRTLSKMNAFDLVVTVALGSTLAATVMNDQVALAEGLSAFALLALLQLAVTFLSVRWKPVREAVKSEPSLLFYDGGFVDGNMKRERVTEDEVLAAMRSRGLASAADVSAVVLETDGTFSVIAGSEDPDTLRNVDRPRGALASPV